MIDISLLFESQLVEEKVKVIRLERFILILCMASAFIKHQSETESICHDHGNGESHFPYIPDSLLLKILYQLPVKSIFRFKCVSKRWLHLISDPSFLRRYMSQLSESDSRPWTLFFRFAREGYFLDLPDEYVGAHYVTSQISAFNSPGFPFPLASFSEQPQQYPSEQIQVLASSNDLLLFYSCTRDYPEPKVLFYLSNPFTKQWIPLPPPPSRGKWGMGFISKLKNGVMHYKVVLITDVSGPQPPLPASRGWDAFHLQTFSSETGEWRKSDLALPEPIRLQIPFHRAIPFDGILHWIEHRLGIVIAYDPYNSTTNGCRFIELPLDRENRRRCGLNAVFDVCQGRLRYFEIANIWLEPGMIRSWSLWEFEHYHTGKWCLQNRAVARKICSLDSHPDIHEPRRTLMPLAFHPLDLDIMYFWCQAHILSYNLRTGLFEPEIYRVPAVGKICWWVVFPIVPPPCPIPAPQPCWNTTVTERKGKLKKILGFSSRCLVKRRVEK